MPSSRHDRQHRSGSAGQDLGELPDDAQRAFDVAGRIARWVVAADRRRQFWRRTGRAVIVSPRVVAGDPMLRVPMLDGRRVRH